MEKNFDDKGYTFHLKNKTKKSYDSLNKIYCPALGGFVHFNSVGFRHLRYKPDGTPRKNKEAIYKLRLFPLVPSVIKKSVKYKPISVRVIILRIGNGKYVFYSVMKNKQKTPLS